MKSLKTAAFCGLCAILVALSFTPPGFADPIPGRDILKFTQKPMIATTITNTNGQSDVFFGHDELSTAYGRATDLPGATELYRGRFMADDFADRFNSPVVHVKWWGSYFEDIINPNFPVNKFLISFEEDIPADPNNPNSFSRPGRPLLNQVVRLDGDGVLQPGEGTYTERLIRGPDPILNESLYEYNAELHFDKAFPEKEDTVYWLKIAALVDVPAGFPEFDPTNPPPDITRWGWHNRDYTIPNPLASGPPAVVPGEHLEGMIGLAPIFHFQDDAVSGVVDILPSLDGGLRMPIVRQDVSGPERYLPGIDGPRGIGEFSKDLAFELYTVPEPASSLLLVLGLVAVFRRVHY